MVVPASSWGEEQRCDGELVTEFHRVHELPGVRSLGYSHGHIRGRVVHRQPSLDTPAVHRARQCIPQPLTMALAPG